MCFTGNTFNLNASEASGFFQGIVTFFSIISGFLYINYERIQRQTELENQTKQDIHKRFRLIKLSIPDLEKIKQLFFDGEKESEYMTLGICLMILISLRDTFSDETVDSIKKACQEIRYDLININASNKAIFHLDTLLTEFETAQTFHKELLSKVSLDDNPRLIISNSSVIYSYADKIDAHLKVCKMKITNCLENC